MQRVAPILALMALGCMGQLGVPPLGAEDGAMTDPMVEGDAGPIGSGDADQGPTETVDDASMPPVTEPSEPSAPAGPGDPPGFGPLDSCGRHIAVGGGGDGSLDAPGSIEALNRFVREVGPGGEVCIHAGTYSTGHVLSEGGAPGAPVTIRGVGGLPVFENDFQASTRAKNGPIAFRVQASYLIIREIAFSHVGECFRFPTGQDVTDVTLARFRAENVATCVNVARGGTQRVEGLTIRESMILQFTRSAIMLAARTTGALIEDCYIDMQPSAIGGRGSDYVTGIALYDEARDIEIRGTTVLDVVGKTSGYSQGDGIDGESSVDGVLVIDSYFRGNQDGCIDTKAGNMIIRDTIAVGCKRNFRLWQRRYPDGPRCEHCISYQPAGDAHFFVYGNEALASDIEVYADNGARLVTTDGGGSLRVTGISGTLRSADQMNVSAEGDTLDYGAAFSIPEIPNPTPFTP